MSFKLAEKFTFKPCWRVTFYLFGAWILNLGESIALMVQDSTTQIFCLEPLRILVTFAAIFIVLLGLIKGEYHSKQMQERKLRHQMVWNLILLVFLLTWALINFEVTLRWKRLQAPQESEYLFGVLNQIFKQVLLTLGFLPLMSKKIIKFCVVWLPFAYLYFRCELYLINAIESTIFLLFSLITAVASIFLPGNSANSVYFSKTQSILRDKNLISPKIAFQDKGNSQSKSPFREKNYNKEVSKQPTNFVDLSKECILDKLPEGIAVINSAGNFEYLNESVLKILNCSEAEVVEAILDLPNRTILEKKKEERAEGNTKKKLKKFSTTEEKLSPQSQVQSRNKIEIEKKVSVANKLSSSGWFNFWGKSKNQDKDESPTKSGNAFRDRDSSFGFLVPEFSNRKQIQIPKSSGAGSIAELNPAADVFSTEKQLQKFESYQVAAEKQTQTYQEKLDKYFQIIFNDKFESDCNNVRQTVDKVFQVLTDLKSNILELESSAGGDSAGSPPKRRMSKMKLKYSTTALSKPDQFLRKLTVCSSFAVTIESFLKVDQNTVKTIDVNLNPLFVEGEIFILLQVRDRTDRDMAKRLKDLNKQKNASLAAITHEFRSPLNGVLSMLETLKPRITQDLREKYLQPAFTSASTLLYLVNDILDLHQMQAKELKLVFMTCKIAEICQHSMNMITFKAEKRGVALEVNLDKKIPKVIFTDPNRLQQILVNLLSNAIKFTEKGKISIVGELIRPNKIRFEVSDTGIGIEHENVKKLFKNFGKLDLGDKSGLNPQGAGLGLCISHGLAKRLNSTKGEGGLSVTSEIGKGTTFSFIIDDMSSSSENLHTIEESDTQRLETLIKELNREPSMSRGASRKLDMDGNEKLILPPMVTHLSLESVMPRKGCNCSEILVVDDDEFNLWAMKNQLETFNLNHVDFATNGDEAVKKFKEKAGQQMSCCRNCYTLIFIDCEMPIKNGIDATREIREYIQKECHHDHTIIGVSGHSEPEFFKRCLDVGMNRVITKPITRKELQKALEAYQFI